MDTEDHYRKARYDFTPLSPDEFAAEDRNYGLRPGPTILAVLFGAGVALILLAIALSRASSSQQDQWVTDLKADRESLLRDSLDDRFWFHVDQEERCKYTMSGPAFVPTRHCEKGRGG